MTGIVSSAGPRAHLILVVDDEVQTRSTNVAILKHGGFQTLEAHDADSALETLRARPQDVAVVLLDIKMPDRKRNPDRAGIAILPEIKAIAPDALVVVFSVVDEVQAVIDALHHRRAFDYLIKNQQGVSNQAILAAVERACEHRRLQLLERRTVQEILQRLLSAVDHRDEETGAHIRRVGESSAILARAIGWPHERVEMIQLAAPMHDIGKVAIPDGILFKPRRLSVAERQVMQYHTIFGANILADSDSPVLQMAEEIALCHHEWFNGEGYPCRRRVQELEKSASQLSEPEQRELRRLQQRGEQKGDRIPQSARVVAIADFYDALTHVRTYRRVPRYLPESAIELMRKAMNEGHLDSGLFDVFCGVRSLVDAMAAANEDPQ